MIKCKLINKNGKLIDIYLPAIPEIGQRFDYFESGNDEYGYVYITSFMLNTKNEFECVYIGLNDKNDDLCSTVIQTLPT